MKKFIYNSILLAIIILFTSCAQSYYAINPTRIVYTASNNLEGISLDYRYDILNEKGNSKMSKKERSFDVKLVAMRITNNTSKVINIGNNAAFFSGNTAIYPLDVFSTERFLNQSAASHLFYLLLTPLTLTVSGASPVPIGLILGPAISVGNMLVASKANNDFNQELLQNDVLFLDIKPGETVYGLVGFKNIDFAPLSLKFIK